MTACEQACEMFIALSYLQVQALIALCHKAYNSHSPLCLLKYFPIVTKLYNIIASYNLQLGSI